MSDEPKQNYIIVLVMDEDEKVWLDDALAVAQEEYHQRAMRWGRAPQYAHRVGALRRVIDKVWATKTPISVADLTARGDTTS